GPPPLSFLHDSPPPRHLHSFPTRRSSDLVFTTEPLPKDSPLWTLENVIVTPHHSGSSPRAGERTLALFAENLRRYKAEVLREQRSEEHTSELQSLAYLVCRLLLEKKK